MSSPRHRTRAGTQRPTQLPVFVCDFADPLEAQAVVTMVTLVVRSGSLAFGRILELPAKEYFQRTGANGRERCAHLPCRRSWVRVPSSASKIPARSVFLSSAQETGASTWSHLADSPVTSKQQRGLERDQRQRVSDLLPDWPVATWPESNPTAWARSVFWMTGGSLLAGRRLAPWRFAHSVGGRVPMSLGSAHRVESRSRSGRVRVRYARSLRFSSAT